MSKTTRYLNSFINKYNKIPRPAKASLWFAICTVIQKGISLITTPIFTRLLTTSQYGVYAVYQSWYMIISSIVTLNLAAGVYNNGLIKYEDDRKRFTSSLLGLSTVVTIFFLIVYLVAIEYWNSIFGLTTPIMLMMFTELLLVPAYNFWAAEQRVEFKYRTLIFVTLFIALSSPALGIATVLMTEHKAEARIFSYVLIQAIVGLVFYIHIMFKGKTVFIKNYWKYALVFNLPLIPHYLSRNILNQADRIMIQSLVGASEAGIYSIAYTISMMMSIVTMAVNASYTPYTYISIKKENFEGLRKNTAGLMIGACMICFCIIAFGPEMIKLIASTEYYEARWIVPPVASASYFIFIMGFYGNVLFYFEKTKLIMMASLIGAGLNVILNYSFIPIFGYIAAAYTTLTCQIAMMIAYYVFYKRILKKEKLSELFDNRILLITSIGICAFSVIITFFYDFLLVRYSILIIMIIIAMFNRNKIKNIWIEIKNNKN